MSRETPALELAGLSVRRDHRTILHDVTLSLNAGEVIGLWGPNGAGKTTLLEGVVGLLSTTGEVRLAGSSVAGASADRRAREGLVLCPSDGGTFPTLTVRENLAAGSLAISRIAERSSQLDEVLEMLPSLTSLLDVPARRLSGGQARLLAVGRALATKPRVLLLDEPATGLAPRAVETLVTTIRRIGATGVAVIVAEQNRHVLLETVGAIGLIRSGRIDRLEPPEKVFLSGGTHAR